MGLHIGLSIAIALAAAATGACKPPYVGPASSNLPLLLIDTGGVRIDDDELWDVDGTRAWAPVEVRLIDLATDGRARFDGPPSWAGRAGLHVRGNSSLDYPKKQYAMECWDAAGEELEVGLLGLPPESDWVLSAPYAEKTLLRAAVMYGWSNAIGRWAPRTRFVELFLGDDGGPVRREDYRGVYVLTEKVKRDADRVAIASLAPEDATEPAVTGGYLLQRDWWDPARPDTWFVTGTYEDVLLWEYPRFDRITDAQAEWLRGWLDAFERALAGPDFADPVLGYPAYADVESFVEHHLLVEMGRPVDGYSLSTYMHKDRGGLLMMGPLWDYDSSLGNADYYEAWRTDGWHYENPDFGTDNPNGFRWYERMLTDPAFRARRADRWAALRAGPLATDVLLADIDAAAALLGEAAARNFGRWPILGERVWPNDEGAAARDSYAAEIAYLRDWLAARLAWMDDAVGGP